MAIMKDRKYRQYAVQEPLNLKKIIQINKWAKTRTLELVKNKYD